MRGSRILKLYLFYNNFLNELGYNGYTMLLPQTLIYWISWTCIGFGDSNIVIWIDLPMIWNQMWTLICVVCYLTSQFWSACTYVTQIVNARRTDQNVVSILGRVHGPWSDDLLKIKVIGKRSRPQDSNFNYCILNINRYIRIVEFWITFGLVLGI